MPYTQDESYYLLDAADDAVVYLGLKTGVDPDAMLDVAGVGARGELSFDAEKYVNAFPARKHDHFSIPAGTVHCSGANSMVLEISATPYLFTFKLWDWGRVGLDGVPAPDPPRPRPSATSSGTATRPGPGTTWSTRSRRWLAARAGSRSAPVCTQLEFIEVRRHWFTDAVEHDTEGTVNVLNLVEGEEAVVVSPTGAFAPFVVHYAETFIVPAPVGRYRIRPHGAGVGTRLATVKAFVRGTDVRIRLVDRPEGGAQQCRDRVALGGTKFEVRRIGRGPRAGPAGRPARRCPTSRPWNRR